MLGKSSATITAAAAKTKALNAVWTFPSIVFAAFLIAWAAEAAQFLVSQGLSLAILAWLQTLPEFAVEAVIAWNQNVPLMTANFTGSLRLLVGLGWPMIYFTRAIFYKNSSSLKERFSPITLDDEHCIEVLALLLPIIYFVLILLKQTLTIIDSAFLTSFYIAYLWLLKKIPPQDEEKLEDIEKIPRFILQQKPALRNSLIISLFVIGGIILYLTVHPFLESMIGIAITFGISQFIFVQWVAPFLSEFPEKLSAFYWAKTVKKAPMAFMNMVSSNINQWTVLVAMIPIVYSISKGTVTPIHLDAHQLWEIALTMAQSFLGFLLLANMQFCVHEAAGIFVLWLVQFIIPSAREAIVFIYVGWILIEILFMLIKKKNKEAFIVFQHLITTKLMTKSK